MLRVEVNPELIRWACERSGLEDDALADIVERTVQGEAGKEALVAFFRAALQEPVAPDQV